MKAPERKKKPLQLCVAAFVTVPTRSEAIAISNRVIRDQLAACANVIPRVTSIYTWKGKIRIGNETLIMFKTTKKRYPSLQKLVKQLHSYEVPEVIGIQLDRGNPQYLEWISDAVTISSGNEGRSSPRGRG